MVREARLCAIESAEEAYGMDEKEFELMKSLQPLDICDHCGNPCEIRSETLISLCDECRTEAEDPTDYDGEEDDAIAAYQDRYGFDNI